jgi:hypothetical protein
LGTSKTYVDPNAWAWGEEGLVKTAYGFPAEVGGDYFLFFQQYEPSGTLFAEKTNTVKSGKGVPLTCAWAGHTFFCTSVSSGLVSLGNTGKEGDYKEFDLLPEQTTAVSNQWDGETFSVHLTSKKFGNGTLELMRINQKGEVVQERTHVATNVHYALSADRPRFVTHALSGRTFVVGASNSEYIRASAHERDGTPLFPMGKLFNTLPHNSNSYPAVGAYGDGVLIATNGSDHATNLWPKPQFYRLSAEGELTTLPHIPLPDGEIAGDNGNIQMAMVAHGPDDAWIVIRTDSKDVNTRLVVVDWKDGAFGPIQEVMSAKDAGKTEKLYFFYFAHLIAFEMNGQRWVGFRDQTVPGKYALRLLRVDDPSCRYPPILP